MTRLLPAILLILLPTAILADESRRSLPTGILEVESRQAPALQLSDMDGEAFDIRNARGQWVFVHFWASWCGPCRKEMPTIQRMAGSLDNAMMQLVLVNTAEDEDSVFSFLGIVAPDLESLMDYDGEVTERWQPRGLPSTFLVDPAGQIRYVALGDRPWDEPAYLGFLRGLGKPE